jgi:hypothetical protein
MRVHKIVKRNRFPNLKQRNKHVRSMFARMELLVEKFAATTDPEQASKIRSELKQLRKTQRAFSLLQEPRSAVPVPRSYVEKRAERIEASHRISKHGRVRLVQGGAPGSGRRK